jgi:hypothetical protein
MALEKELEVYQRELPKLLAQAGKFAVIFDDTVVGVFATYEDALQAGYAKAGLDPFLIKRIEATETVQCFTRELVA